MGCNLYVLNAYFSHLRLIHGGLLLNKINKEQLHKVSKTVSKYLNDLLIDKRNGPKKF